MTTAAGARGALPVPGEPSPRESAREGRNAPRRSRRSARTRERILAAATEVFARRGFHGARVADIAEAAGMAYGLVYHHFRNKDEILAAIFQERWGMYMDHLAEVAATPAPFRDRVTRLVRFWVETYHAEPHLMTVMINEISRSYEFIESHDVHAVLAAFDAVERILADAREAGEVRADLDPQLLAYAVVGIAEMVLTGYVMGTLRRRTAAEYAQDSAQLVGLLLDGMAARA